MAKPLLTAPSAPAVILPVFAEYQFHTVAREFVCAEHQHVNHEVICSDVGTYRCQLNRVSLALPPRHLLLIKPGDLHADVSRPGDRFFAIQFRLQRQAYPEESIPLLIEQIAPAQQVLNAEGLTLWPLLRQMEEEMRVADETSAMVQDALLREFFWRTVRAIPRELISPLFQQSSSAQHWLRSLNQLFCAHRHHHLTLTEMAEAMQVSERTLTSRCRELLNDSPSRAFMRYKMEHAMSLLTQSTMTVKEISYTLGFANPYHFSRAFKMHFGVPPSKYRD
ncbi:MAG TPA: helix-turn-helix transcriptional regulator [Armatimonadota bacterium]|jgi:AraC family transcriptional activator of pobA